MGLINYERFKEILDTGHIVYGLDMGGRARVEKRGNVYVVNGFSGTTAKVRPKVFAQVFSKHGFVFTDVLLNEQEQNWIVPVKDMPATWPKKGQAICMMWNRRIGKSKDRFQIKEWDLDPEYTRIMVVEKHLVKWCSAIFTYGYIKGNETD